MNVEGGRTSATGGANSGSNAAGGSGSSASPQGGASSIIPLDVGGATAPASSAGGDPSGLPPSAEENCGSQTQNTKHQLVDILLVLDRSSSMLQSFSEDCFCDQASSRIAGYGGKVCSNTANCTNRWVAVSAGIASAVSSTPFLQWGLKLYSTPGNDVCGVSAEVEVGIPSGNANAIRDAIASTTPANYTPTAAAITAAANYLKGLTDGNPKVILLATDGEPNCATPGSTNSDIKGAKTAIETAFQAGIKTFVIGIGPKISNLNELATAGHTNKYYPATSPETLNEALNAIGTAVVSCSFTLGDTPDDTDMNNVAVYLDKNLLPKDDPNGWSFGSDGKTIELNGQACETIKTQVTSAVQVLFGCKVPPKWIP